MTDKTLELLTAPFDGYFTAQGVFGPFLSGEQIVSRMNDVFGVHDWSFKVLKFDIDTEADEVVVLGEISVKYETMEGQFVAISKQQFGGQKIHRARETGRPLNLADDHKGAATDAMKKCASLLGVGLYMMVSQAEWHGGVPPAQAKAAQRQNANNGTQATPAAERPDTQPAAAEAVQRPVRAPVVPFNHMQRVGPHPNHVLIDKATHPGCQACGEPIIGLIKTRQGEWTPNKLANQGRRRHGQVLCAKHYGEAERMLEATTGTVDNERRWNCVVRERPVRRHLYHLRRHVDHQCGRRRIPAAANAARAGTGRAVPRARARGSGALRAEGRS